MPFRNLPLILFLAAMILPVPGHARVWTNVTAPGDVYFRDVAASETAVVAVGDNGTVMRSIDGVNWVRVEAGMPSRIRFIKHADGTFLLGGNDGLRFSSDGIDWTRPPITELPADIDFRTAAHFAGEWLAFSDGVNQRVFSSMDLETWMETGMIGAVGVEEVVTGDGVMVGQFDVGPPTAPDGRPAVSTDGIAWNTTENQSIDDLHRDADRFIASGPHFFSGLMTPTITTSADGIAWNVITYPQLAPGKLSAVSGNDDERYLTALAMNDGTTDLLISDDLMSWNAEHSVDGRILEILHWRGRWIAVGDGIHVGTRGDPLAVPLFTRTGIILLVLLLLVPALFVAGRRASRS